MTAVLHAGRFLELVADDGWEYVRRRNATAVVGIVAVTPDGGLLLVEQRRIPVRGPVIELPAGLVGDGDAGEDVCAAAARELAEETGWLPSRCAILARGPSSAGLASEVATLVLAQGLRRTGPGGGVAGESIRVHEVALAGAPAWLHARAAEGTLLDHKIHAALWWLCRSGAQPSAPAEGGRHGC